MVCTSKAVLISKDYISVKPNIFIPTLYVKQQQQIFFLLPISYLILFKLDQFKGIPFLLQLSIIYLIQ
jgi:hypothetical protein